MKADVSNYDANIAKARRALDGFKQDNLTMGGILNQSTKSIVGLAAQYASFAAVLGTVASGFAEAVSKGKEMSREAEGVKMAFDRLNQPGLLDSLREATHGTVNDLELMKQAVKFDNFNLSLEQMGTFLAFAQQQAKDTGQDVNYLVDSIVTGLGRKSLPILDNLGLSAEDIKTRMKETGDMTTAVAQIIEERMSAAGDYVETAADRAAQSQARLDNAMKELGDTMNSLTGAGASLWSELEIGAINLANTAIKPLISLFNELASYIQGPTVEGIITGGLDDVTDTVDDNGRLIRKNAINSIPEITVSGTAPKKKKKTTTGGTKTDPSERIQKDFEKAMAKANLGADSLKAEVEHVSVFDKFKEQAKFDPENVLGSKDNWEKYKDTVADSIGGIGESLDNLTKWTDNFDPYKEKMDTLTEAARQQQMAFAMAGESANNFGAALASLDDPAAKAAGQVISAIASIALGFGQAVAQAGTMGPWAWLAYVAAGTAALATTISTVHSLTGYAEGGMVSGTSYSGDNIPIMANAGELVLTKAQQNTLAQNLQGGGMGSMNLKTKVKGTELLVWLDNSLAQSGRGELVTWGT